MGTSNVSSIHLRSMRDKRLVRLRAAIAVVLCAGFCLASPARAETRTAKFYSPVRVEIKIKRDTFKVREPVEGVIVLDNMYPAPLPATFRIQLFHDGEAAGERITSVRHVPLGRTAFTFKNFGVPEFNNNAGAEGLWRIRVQQQSMDDSYARDVTVRIVPAVSKQ